MLLALAASSQSTRAAASPTAIRAEVDAPASTPFMVPGPERPGIPPKHPALQNPAPSLAQLAQRAAAAPAEWQFPLTGQPADMRNAHYTNTRAQLAYALTGPYNAVEGDVRMRDGMPVMQHDKEAGYDLTFEQWALLASRAGKHLRIDLKDASTMSQVAATLDRLGVPQERVTFNVGVSAPWASNNMSTAQVRTLRERFPRSWITLNQPLPLAAGEALVSRIAKAIGRDRLGVAVMSGLVNAHDVAFLRRYFAAVNAWNLPLLGEPDHERDTAKLRAMGVNGMIDLRRRDDPLADD